MVQILTLSILFLATELVKQHRGDDLPTSLAIQTLTTSMN